MKKKKKKKELEIPDYGNIVAINSPLKVIVIYINGRMNYFLKSDFLCVLTPYIISEQGFNILKSELIVGLVNFCRKRILITIKQSTSSKSREAVGINCLRTVKKTRVIPSTNEG